MDVIETREARIDGITCTVTLYQDPESTPFDADCYAEQDITAWNADLWHFVGVEVKTTMSSAAVWGVQYGWVAGTAIGIDEIIESHASDLFAEAFGM